MSQKERAKQRAANVQHLVASDDDLDPRDAFNFFLKNQKIEIIVSYVENPCDFTIQLVENIKDLENLMNDLEKTYHGFGSSYYDMPSSYIHTGGLCVGRFPLEDTWHRCRILEVNSKKKMAKVSYIGFFHNNNLLGNKINF